MGIETSYKVYRQETSSGEYNNDNFQLIKVGVKDNFFIDIDYVPIVPALPTNTTPPDITITEFSPPSNLTVYSKTNISQTIIGITNPNKIRIILYQKNTTEIPQFHLERFKALLDDIIPPEIGYTVILCNDNYSKILF